MKINKNFRVFVLVFMLFGISSCTTKMAYNNLDWIISWYVDDFVTLNDEQEKELNTIVTSFLLWHRKFELQNYVLQIKYIKIDLEKGESQSNVGLYIDSFKQFWQSILIKAEPDIVKFSDTLTAEQVENFLAEMEKKNLDKLDEFKEDTPQERLDNRFDKIEDRITSFTGYLTKEQKQLLHKANQSIESTFNERIEFRRAWASAIRETFIQRSNKLVFEQSLRKLILQSDDYRSAVYLKKLEVNKQIWINVIEQLISSLNKEQRKKLNAKLDDIIEDLEALY
ncbi:DUF6279 family lipoprotein [Psychromonas sp.]|nr:DUF6279 family lipoprotein [Psychromonas sp.]